MSNIVKRAYDAGARQALIDAGLIKEATFTPAMEKAMMKLHLIQARGLPLTKVQKLEKNYLVSKGRARDEGLKGKTNVNDAPGEWANNSFGGYDSYGGLRNFVPLTEKELVLANLRNPEVAEAGMAYAAQADRALRMLEKDRVIAPLREGLRSI